MSTTSSRSPVQTGKPPAALLSSRERAFQPALARKLFFHRILRCERRIKRPCSQRQGSAAIKKPTQADVVLASLAACYAPGKRLSNGDIMRAAGVCKRVAIAVRLWAKTEGLWPYAVAIGRFGRRPAGGGEP